MGLLEISVAGFRGRRSTARAGSTTPARPGTLPVVLPAAHARGLGTHPVWGGVPGSSSAVQSGADTFRPRPCSWTFRPLGVTSRGWSHTCSLPCSLHQGFGEPRAVNHGRCLRAPAGQKRCLRGAQMRERGASTRVPGRAAPGALAAFPAAVCTALVSVRLQLITCSQDAGSGSLCCSRRRLC